MQTMIEKRRSALVAVVCLGLGLGTLSLGARAADADEGDRASETRTSKRSAFAGVVNLNLATPDELMELPGIGPAKAERIMSFRKTRGGFKRVEDLMKVKGIGRKTFAKLKAHLALSGPGATREGASDAAASGRQTAGKKTPMVH